MPLKQGFVWGLAGAGLCAWGGRLAAQAPASATGIMGPAAPMVGSAVQLTAVVTGSSPMTYQWYFNSAAIAGATSWTLTLPNLTAAQNGLYTLTATNPSGSRVIGPYWLEALPSASISGLVDGTFAPLIDFVPGGAAVQADGKVILTGSSVFSTYPFPQSDTKMATLPFYGRWNSDGSPDTAFDAEAGNLAPAFAAAPTALVQANGQIILSQPGDSSGHPPMAVRLNADGSPDSSFSPPTITVGGTAYPAAVPTLQLSNGQYLALPEANGYDTWGGMVQRLNADGSIDSSFVSWPASDLPPARGPVSVQFDSLGRPWVNGVRLNADGTLDPAFTRSGLAASGRLGLNVLATRVIGDQLLVAFSYQTVQENEPELIEAVERLNADGTVDGTYGPVSIATGNLSFGPAAIASDGTVYWVAAANYTPSLDLGLLQPTAGGFYANTYRNGLIRITPAGALDPSYALNLVPDPLPPSYFAGMAWANASQLCVWGNFTALNGAGPSYLARINPAAGSQLARLINVSARGTTGSADGAVTDGFVIGGSGSDSLLLRGVGPSLAAFGLSNAISAAQLVLFNGQQQQVASNDGWMNNPDSGSAVASLSAALGAFPLSSTLDAATMLALQAGDYTVEVTDPSNVPGVALAEVYDASAGSQPYGAAHLINVSTRAFTGPGDGTLVAGFTIGGGNNERVLIRATGAGLSAFGVADGLPSPRLSVYSGQTLISTGPLPASVSDAGAVEAAAPVVGAFPGADTAICLTLAPGPYTVQVSKAGGGSGVALLEVYEVP